MTKTHDSSIKTQLDLGIARSIEQDRNYHKGGRSFYFFDFDDNVAVLNTPIFIFEKNTGREVKLSSGDFAAASKKIGLSGEYKNFAMDFNDKNGSFRCFRDRPMNLIQKILGKQQIFCQDLAEAMQAPDFHWKGPSWSCFYHAVFNRRPVSVITARGHHPETIKNGIKLFLNQGHIPHEPNYLSVFPVSHPETRSSLGFAHDAGVAEMKQAAIHRSVERAIEVYGYNDHHRFGMSDDDPKNIELIVEEMTRLKKIYKNMSFFVISTHGGVMVKREVFADYTRLAPVKPAEQLALF